MPDKLKEFVRQTIDEILANTPSKERLKGLTPAERLEGLPAERRLEGVTMEELARALSQDEIDALVRFKANRTPEENQ
jgi:cytochrome c553